MPSNNTEYGKQMKEENRQRLKEIVAVLRKYKLHEGLTPVKLRCILEELGPTYVKLGQIMSLHSDILPKQYCEELMKLNSDVAPMPFSDVKQVLEEEYKASWKEIFRSIDEKPIGSASIAQVHHAILANGEEVIIKVQRRGIYETMNRDIRLMRKATRLIPPVAVKEVINLPMVLDELWDTAQQEMDFLKEADNMEEFAANNRSVRFVAVPKLYRSYTTRRVLVMEYIDGYSVDDKAALEADGYDLEEIGRKLVDNFVRQVMVDGFFHADPHPGNVKIRDGKIVWIDMGMMGRLTDHDRKYLTEVVIGIATYDVARIEDAILALGDFKEKPDKSSLYQGIHDLLDDYGHAGFGDIDIAQVTQDLLEVMKENGIGLPHGFSMLGRGLTQLEGVLTSIAPDLNMVEIASSRVIQQMKDDFSFHSELSRVSRKAAMDANKVSKLPELVTDMLEDYRHGQGGMRLTLSSSSRLAWLLRKLVRNIVMGLWVMGLLIGSSIICTTDMKPQVLGIPLIGFVGYLMAFVIVVYILIRHFVDNKRGRGQP